MTVTKKIETKSATIWIDDEEILHLKIKEGARVHLPEIKTCFDIYEKFGFHKQKALQLMEGGRFFTFDHDAMLYASKQGKNIFLASAIVHDAVAIRMLYNFFNRFYNNPVPFKMFGAKEEALRWLRTFRN